MNEDRIIKLKNFLDKEDIQYKNIEIFISAFTHKSVIHDNNENVAHYERLEFLGDSILGYIVTKFLYETYPELKEGQMTEIKNEFVCGKYLTMVSKELGFEEMIYYGKSIQAISDNIYENVFESLLAAILIDSEIDKVEMFIDKYLLSKIKEKYT